MTVIPTRKISETLLEFAKPLLDELPPAHSKVELEAALALAACVWNACVLDQWHRTTSYTDQLRGQAAPGYETEMALILSLIERKRYRYADDPRGVGHWSVVDRDGAFSFRAEARLDVEKVKVSGGLQ